MTINVNEKLNVQTPIEQDQRQEPTSVDFLMKQISMSMYYGSLDDINMAKTIFQSLSASEAEEVPKNVASVFEKYLNRDLDVLLRRLRRLPAETWPTYTPPQTGRNCER